LLVIYAIRKIRIEAFMPKADPPVAASVIGPAEILFLNVTVVAPSVVTIA
jgi:hypothetical protein